MSTDELSKRVRHANAMSSLQHLHGDDLLHRIRSCRADLDKANTDPAAPEWVKTANGLLNDIEKRIVTAHPGQVSPVQDSTGNSEADPHDQQNHH